LIIKKESRTGTGKKGENDGSCKGMNRAEIRALQRGKRRITYFPKRKRFLLVGVRTEERA